MSILVELETSEEKREEDEDILAFGYSCKLYRDDAKALLEDSGALLIPWMGDSSLMIDRYDVRNRLEDKSQFGLKPNIPHKISAEEEQLEDMLDKERYLSLDCDILEEALREEEEEKRRRETEAGSGTFHAVGYSYAEEYGEEEGDDGATQPACQHPATLSVDIREDPFVLPPDLVVPDSIRLPSTNKLHSIIERTAQFVCQQGQQMEIIIKTKQKYNPFFSFLDHGDLLNPYYRHLLLAIGNKSYIPKPQVSVQMDEPDNKTPASNQEQSTQQQQDSFENESKSDTGSGSDDSDEEGYELHPLLRGGRVGPVPPSKGHEPKSLSEGERGPLYTNTVPINLAPAVSADSHADLNTRGEMAMLDSTQMQLHGSADSQGRGYPTGHQCSDDPYNAYCYQMQLAEYQYNLHAYYQAMSSQGIIGNGPTPPPPDMQPVVDKTAEYVAKNDEGFERTVLDKHCDDPKFAFLNPWNQYHAYYQMKKEEFRKKRKIEELEKENALNKPNVQRLGVNGAVSFKLAIKSSKPLTPKVDLNVEEEDGGEGEGEGEGGHRELSDKQDDHRSNVRELAGESEPAAKKPRCSTEEEEKMDCKVQEFLSRVKQMINTN
ncbi:hypothetical protein EMCRGX_G024489 [Ephydatia muelleri]